MNTEKLFKDYGLSIVLVALFLASWVGQGYFQWNEYRVNELEEGRLPETSEFMTEFGARTFENWQSEFLQLFTFVILSTYLIHKHRPQSRDSEDEILERVKNIERKIKKS